MTTVEAPLEVTDFLEHFGIRGMKWGSRKQNRKPPKPGSFRASSKSNKRKTYAVLGGSAGIAGAAVAAALLMNSRDRRGLSASSIRRGKEAAKGMFDSEQLLRDLNAMRRNL